MSETQSVDYDKYPTFHIGSREPKAYKSDPNDPQAGVPDGKGGWQLADEQPGKRKCRIKIRKAPTSTLVQFLDEAQRAWNFLDHGKAPAWVSGTNELMTQALAEQFGCEVREWQPEEGDE